MMGNLGNVIRACKKSMNLECLIHADTEGLKCKKT